MSLRNQRILASRRIAGWAYGQIPWVSSEEEAQKLAGERHELLEAVSGRCKIGFAGTKVYRGDLSPGCRCCGEGTWSCLYTTQLCTGGCSFCPNEVQKGIPPNAHRLVFAQPAQYAAFVGRFGYRGVGFSGGDAILALENVVLPYARELRKRLGDGVYLWGYTNGNLVTAEHLSKLRDVGVNEIRFDIAAQSYSLEKVILAKRYVDHVTVEIPVLSDDFPILRTKLQAMADAGVSYLNLHQLMLSEHNLRSLLGRAFKFLRSVSSHQTFSSIDSEITALRLLNYAEEKGIPLSMNYCSSLYKVLFQGRADAVRASAPLRSGYEELTEVGNLRHFCVSGPTDELRKLTTRIGADGHSTAKWTLNCTDRELYVHSSLLGYLDPKVFKVSIRYYRAAYVPEIERQALVTGYSLRDASVATAKPGATENSVPAERMMQVVRERILEVTDLSAVSLASFKRLFLDRPTSYGPDEGWEASERPSAKDRTDRFLLERLGGLELMPHGLSEIY